MKTRKLAIVFLGLGTVLFAIAPPILKLLTEMGGRVGLRMPGAISFCNVLFVGNFCAGILTLIFFGPRKILSGLAGVSRKTKGYLVLSALVSTIYPALLFTGLERTTVINVVILSRFNGIVLVILGYLFLRTMIDKWEVMGYSVMAAGVLLLLVVSNRGLAIRAGEMFVIASTVFFAITEILSKKVLRDCPVSSYIFFRNLVSSIVFFTLAVYFFGFDHFSEAFGGELWILMVVYAGFGVVAAQFLWLRAVPALSIQTVANYQLLNPVFTILFAFLLLNEIPGPMEWLVIGIILVGILIPRIAGVGRVRGNMGSIPIDTALAAR